MSLYALKHNVQLEKEIINELLLLSNQLEKTYYGRIEEKKLINETINSLILQLRIINKSLPIIIQNISITPKPEIKEKKKGKQEKKREKLVQLAYKGKELVTITEENKKHFLEQLTLSQESLKRLKKQYKLKIKRATEFKKPSLFAKISNKIFSRYSSSLIEKGYFRKVDEDLKKANMHFLLNTYLSIMLSCIAISIILAIFLLIFLLFFEFSFTLPFFQTTEEGILTRLVKNLWLLFFFPILTFISFYFYPGTERDTKAKKINQELPFVVIQMSAIAGSGIEPTQIFKIIALSKDYPATKQELKKVINQVNVYGYDLVTALKNSARLTASKKLAELFNGLSTTITTGGSLTEFLDKRAESLLFTYKLEREKYTKVAETFMDIYISVVIAAPMIMMILLILLTLTPGGLGIEISVISLIMVLIVSLINVFFLIFLHLKQPII